MPDYIASLTDEVTARIAGCFVDDDKHMTGVSVHLRGVEYPHGKVWQFAQIFVTEPNARNKTAQPRLAHEIAVNTSGPLPTLNTLLGLYLSDEKQVKWLAGMVEQYLAPKPVLKLSTVARGC